MIKTNPEISGKGSYSPSVLKHLPLDSTCIKIWVIVSLVVVGLLVVVSCLSLALIIPPWTPLVCLALLLIPVIALTISSIKRRKEQKIQKPLALEKEPVPPLENNTNTTLETKNQESIKINPSTPQSPTEITEALINKLFEKTADLKVEAEHRPSSSSSLSSIDFTFN